MRATFTLRTRGNVRLPKLNVAPNLSPRLCKLRGYAHLARLVCVRARHDFGDRSVPKTINVGYLVRVTGAATA